MYDELFWADRQPVTNTKRADRNTWKWLYEDGVRPARYPVPAALGALIKWYPWPNGAVYFYTNSVWTLTLEDE